MVGSLATSISGHPFANRTVSAMLTVSLHSGPSLFLGFNCRQVEFQLFFLQNVFPPKFEFLTLSLVTMATLDFVVPTEPDDLLECASSSFMVAICADPADISEYNQLDMVNGWFKTWLFSSGHVVTS
jgi:hypothetical protein